MNDTISAKSISIVCATISQALSKFLNCVLQCTGICLEALRVHTVKPIHEWTQNDIDDVVNSGDCFYNDIVRNNPRMLRVNELPLHFEKHDAIYQLEMLDAHTKIGFVREIPTCNHSPLLLYLEEALQNSFLQAPNASLIFRNTTILLSKAHGRYYLFDSRTEE